MAEPIVFISHCRIVDGKRAEFAQAFADAVGQIRQSKPRTALFAAYVDEAGTAVKIIHVFPDAAAMADHFRGADERTRSVSEMVVPTDFEVYGPAPAAAIAQLRQEAAAHGGAVELLVDSIGGFFRAGRNWPLATPPGLRTDRRARSPGSSRSSTRSGGDAALTLRRRVAMPSPRRHRDGAVVPWSDGLRRRRATRSRG